MDKDHEDADHTVEFAGLRKDGFMSNHGHCLE